MGEERTQFCSVWGAGYRNFFPLSLTLRNRAFLDILIVDYLTSLWKSLFFGKKFWTVLPVWATSHSLHQVPPCETSSQNEMAVNHQWKVLYLILSLCDFWSPYTHFIFKKVITPTHVCHEFYNFIHKAEGSGPEGVGVSNGGWALVVRGGSDIHVIIYLYVVASFSSRAGM